MGSSQFELSPAPADIISRVAFGPGSSTRLLVSSWDKHVYLYDVQAAPGGKLLHKFEHPAPVLDVCFGDDDKVAFSACLDWEVRKIDLETGALTTLSTHDAAASALAYHRPTQCLVSSSWDCTLHIHHPAAPPSHTPATLTLPAKPFALALSPTKLVVAMAGRALHIYDIAALSLLASQASQDAPNSIDAEPYQRRESSLKFLTRALACMPDDAGFACSSIEGRVAVDWFDAAAAVQAKKYAFKCHRQPAPDDPGTDIVHPVHALAFHPGHGTFVSGGGDGVVALWDAAAKRRIRQYHRFPTSVVAMSFSGDGGMLAVAVSPGFEDARDEMGEGPVGVYVRTIGDEARGKGDK